LIFYFYKYFDIKQKKQKMAHEMLTDEQISDFKDAFALFDQGI
jgi:Ca2+-binding EF-hand superfamily protein